jgi:hypothetical protein
MLRGGGVGLLVAGLALAAATPAIAEPAVGIVAGGGNALVTFDTATPGAYTSLRTITGLQPGERIVGIDFRYNPLGISDAGAAAAAMRLYAVGAVDAGASDTLRLYTLDPGSGVATQIGTGVVSVTGGGAYGVDFNPVDDNLRLINDGEENVRLDPNHATRADVLGGGATDLTTTGQRITAIAHDRVDTAPTPSTLYGISATTGGLVTIGGPDGSPTPDNGDVFAVGPLGFTLDPLAAAGSVAFDISPSGVAYVSAVADDLAPALYTVNLATGAATAVGNMTTALRSLAIIPPATVKLAAATYSVSEAAGSATITATRTGSITGSSSVVYGTSDGSAAGTLTFAPGQTSATFVVPVANDTIDAPDRSVTISLRAADALVSVAAPAAATLTVVDDDPTRDSTAPKVSLTGPKSISFENFIKHGLIVTIKPNEAARMQVALAGSLSKARVSAVSYNVDLRDVVLSRRARTRKVTLKPNSKLVGRPHKAFKVQVSILATDAAGNRGAAHKTFTVRAPKK